MPVRREIFWNPSAAAWNSPAPPKADAVAAFHQQLPDYAPTRIVSLESLAQDLGVAAVHVKDESSRFGLPSFKILGASWGSFRAIVQRLGLPSTASLEEVRTATAAQPLRLFAATDGNHGRAVARIGSILGVPAEIYVPSSMHPATVQLIQSEGAQVVPVRGSYDEAVQAACAASQTEDGILVQDTAFDGYESIPAWIVDGYQTMVREVDDQLGHTSVDLVVMPVGVGSLAQAVVSHYKAPGRSTKILAVEPDTAACLWKSLKEAAISPIETHHTIMSGLDCGTVSSLAWPLLRNGVDASITVSDYEAHQALLLLETYGVSAGPCGSASLAALRRLTAEDRASLGLNETSVVVLLCTEGSRKYDIPQDVSIDDSVSLTQALVRIDSAIPGTGSITGPGETEIARYVAAWLEHRDIEVHWIEDVPGRPSVVGVARGSGGGKSLMFNGHLDTVTTASYLADPFSGHIENGKLYGRGACDMKSGVAAMLAATAQAKLDNLRGDVIFAGVADEEAFSIGTEQLLKAGWRADGAIVCEPTAEHVLHAHRGFVWVEVDIYGMAAHGSLFDVGIDAITRAGHFLVALEEYCADLVNGPSHPVLGVPSAHASIIQGGEEPASYPAKCTITLEKRTVEGETAESVVEELKRRLEDIAARIPNYRYDIRATFSRPPFYIPSDHALIQTAVREIAATTGTEPPVHAEKFWTDCALLWEKGIPALLYGPYGEGLHGKEEWADVNSIERVTRSLVNIARASCS